MKLSGWLIKSNETLCLAHCCRWLMTVVDSVAAVRLDEESGRLAGDHRVAHVRSVAVRVAGLLNVISKL
jgi:hypothetical protein